mgnify:CR=1 FL=1
MASVCLARFSIIFVRASASPPRRIRPPSPCAALVRCGKEGGRRGGAAGAAGGAAVVAAGDRSEAVMASGTPLTVRLNAPITVLIERDHDHPDVHR